MTTTQTPSTTTPSSLLQLKNPSTLDQFLNSSSELISLLQTNSTSSSANIQQYIFTINQLLTLTVHANIRPCLIYQHISQTFCSIIQAYQDKDYELLLQQITQIRQTIKDYLKKSSTQNQQKNYQCLPCIQLGWTISSKKQKQQFIQKTQILLKQYLKLFQQNNIEKLSKKISLYQQKIIRQYSPIKNKILAKISVINHQYPIINKKLAEEKKFVSIQILKQCQS